VRVESALALVHALDRAQAPGPEQRRDGTALLWSVYFHWFFLSGHFLVEERPRETLAALREFLGPGHG
jgi:hypothetical protein